MRRQRPRSIDVDVPNNMPGSDVFNAILTHEPLKPLLERVESIYQIGYNLFNISVEEATDANEIKNQILGACEAGIQTAHGVLTVKNASDPIRAINIRAVPTEATDLEIATLLSLYQCGRVIKAVRINHTGTKYHNGYRRILIADYEPGRIPAYIKIRGFSCKVFLPPGEQTSIICNRCLQEGHLAKDCNNEMMCLFCKKTGHKRTTCTALREEYPTAAENRILNPNTTQKQSFRHKDMNNVAQEENNTELEIIEDSIDTNHQHEEQEEEQEIENNNEQDSVDTTPAELHIHESDHESHQGENMPDNNNGNQEGESIWEDISQHTIQQSTQIPTPTSPTLQTRRRAPSNPSAHRITEEFRNIHASPIKRQRSTSSDENVQQTQNRPSLPPRPSNKQRRKGVAGPELLDPFRK